MPSGHSTRRIASPWGDLELTPVERPRNTPSGPGNPDPAPARSPRPERRADGRPRASRAAQFMPFAALIGYYDLVREQEIVTEPRHELTEEEAEELSRAILQTRRGDLIRLTYYDRGGYKTRAGVVEAIDPVRRSLRLGQQAIAFDDIWKLIRA